MKIIILEGIATSGKTSIKDNLVKILSKKGISFLVIKEDVTLLPLLENKDRQISIDFLRKMINDVIKKDKEVIIFDRLFFSHIFRTNSSIEEFRKVEGILKEKSFLAFLEIDESKIPDRIEYVREHRDSNWNEYVNKKGSDEEIYEYYINQQKILRNLLMHTSLKYAIYNTTNMDFKDVAYKIITDLNKK